MAQPPATVIDLINTVSTSTLGIGYTLTSTLAFAGIPSICILYGGDRLASAGLGLSWTIAGPISLLWGVVAFSLAYGKSIPTGVIGGTTYAPIDTVGNDLSFPYYAFMFAMTASAIIVGGAGAASGLKSAAFQLIMMGSLLLNYAPLAHWFWNAGSASSPPGWAWRFGVIDFAGGCVIHGYAGTAVLVLGLLSKARRVKIDYGSPITILAALGFFVGKQALQVSGGSIDGQWSSLGAFNTLVAAYAGAITFNVANVLLPRDGGAPLSGAATAASAVKGALVGTVTMTAGAGYQQPGYAVLSTVCAASLVYAVDYLTRGVDVAGFDCFVMHGVSGFVGSAVVGLFANNKGGRLFTLGSPYAQNYAGAFFGNPRQLGLQLAGVAFTLLLTTAVTVGLYAVAHVVMLPFGGAWEKKEGAGGRGAPAEAAEGQAQDARGA
jgi:Amt family ammonium transporter